MQKSPTDTKLEKYGEGNNQVLCHIDYHCNCWCNYENNAISLTIQSQHLQCVTGIRERKPSITVARHTHHI